MQAWTRRGDVRLAVGAGVLYGVVAQLAARTGALEELFGVMSFGYVFLLPVVLGMVTASMVAQRGRLFRTLGAALLTGLLCLAVAFAVGWEGSICLVMAAPVYCVGVLVGALMGHGMFRDGGPGGRYLALSAAMLTPLASAGVESQLPEPQELRVVHNSIEIEATPEVVWQHIARVAPITEAQDSFFFTMGFPRPVEATLSHEGVGGVRHARFERGLLFLETVTHWQPPEELRFAIEVDPAHTPLTTLDPHVTVGGAYFDVLHGGYRIEPLSPHKVRLHLRSEHRLSTHYNFYAARWSDFLMSEIQRNILRVLRARSEDVGRI